MRPIALRFPTVFILLYLLVSSSVAVYGQTGGPEGIGCPVVFDLVPFSDDGDDGGDRQGRVLQPPPCPTLCGFTSAGEGTFYCNIPVLNDNVNPFIIEISHPQLEETLTLFVAPHPTYPGRLLISFPQSSPFVLLPEMCSGNLFIYSSSGVRLEIMINFDLEQMLMTVELPHGVTFNTRLQNCERDEVDPEITNSLRSLPHSYSEISVLENHKDCCSRQNRPYSDNLTANYSIRSFTNPVAEELIIRFEEVLKVDAEIVVFSMQGQLIERHPAPGGASVFSMLVNHLTPGGYCLRINFQNGTAQKSHIFIKH